MFRPRTVRFPLALAAAALAAGTARADLASWTDGHGDIGIEYDAAAGEFELHFHMEGGVVDGTSRPDQEFEPDELQVVVSDTAGRNFDSVPNGFEFSGMTPDGNPNTIDYRTVPSVDTDGIPFLGFATEEGFGGSDFESIVMSLTGFSGPGEFSLWTNGFFGPTPLMTTFDGVDGDDFFTLPEGSHNHYNLGFSEAGIYDLDFTATGVLAGGGGTVTDSATFRFAVGSPAAVPEPGTVALVGLAACGLAGGATRRRRSAAPAA